jgi:hypothetical protein
MPLAVLQARAPTKFGARYLRGMQTLESCESYCAPSRELL